MNQIGRILGNPFPEIYDTPRAIEILGPDMAQDVVDINQANPKTGKLYDVTTGKYEVQVDIGPGYETKRTEILQGLVSVFQAVPQVGAVLGDMVLRLMDFRKFEEAADRIKRYIMSTMPGVIIDEGSGPREPRNEGEIQQVIMDLKKVTEQHLVTMRENQQMQMIIQQLQAQLKDKQEDRQIDMDKTVIKANAEVQKAEMEHQHRVQHERTTG